MAVGCENSCSEIATSEENLGIFSASCGYPEEPFRRRERSPTVRAPIDPMRRGALAPLAGVGCRFDPFGPEWLDARGGIKVILGGGVFAPAVLVLWPYCILDVIATNESPIRNLPKVVWHLFVILVPTVGSIAWLLPGRPQKAGSLQATLLIS
jgi:hypothetical protein